MATGLGMIAGPSIGTLLFCIAGYNGMLLCASAIFFVITVTLPFVLPSFIDTEPETHPCEIEMSPVSTLQASENQMEDSEDERS